MKSRRLFHQKARFLLAFSLSLFFSLVLALIFFAYRQLSQAGNDRVSSQTVEHYLSSRSKILADLLNHELEKVQTDTKFIAEWTSHVFTHPESYRLAAQPGEYDYDPASGLYGSVRNDGASVAFLSSATFLNPDIIRDIRLTEYLNPILRNIAGLNPGYHSISLFTADSLVRSFPWFDHKQRISSKLLKPNFAVSQFSFFTNAAPDVNPQRKPVWTIVSDSSAPQPKVVCSAPFFAGETLKGVIAIDANITQTASTIFERIGNPDELSLLLSDRNSVLARSKTLKVTSGGSLGRPRPITISEIGFDGSDTINSFIERLPSGGVHFKRMAGFYLQVLSTKHLPAKLVMLLPEPRAASLGLLAPGAVPWLPNTESALAAMTVALLALFNSIWIYRVHREVATSTNQLETSLSALAAGDLDSARMVNPRGIFGDLFKRLNDSLQSLNKELETLQAKPDHPELPTDSLGEAKADLDSLSMQLQVFSCFEAADSIELNLSRLLDLLGVIFLADRAWFMFYDPGDRLLRGHWIGRGVPVEVLRELSVSVRQESDLEKVLGSRQVIYANSFGSGDLHSTNLSRIISRNAMVGPLTDEQRAFGVLVLADRQGGFSGDDQKRFWTLQAAVSKVLRNVLQCEGFRRVDLLKREYLAELTKAAEIPLDRIRTEVQSIYSRLGRLTPYYKQHCEVILFEVGKLYEIAREFNGFEVDSMSMGASSSADSSS